MIKDLEKKISISKCTLFGIRQSVHFTVNCVPFNPRIRSSVRLTVYCSAIKNGDIKEWDFAYKMYQESNVAAEKSRLMIALSCSKEVWVLSRSVNVL